MELITLLGVTLQYFTDRVYRFNVADSMSVVRFKLSATVNGEYGPDGYRRSTADDNGTEYTTGKTTNGTAGSSGAYVQYDFSQDKFT